MTRTNLIEFTRFLLDEYGQTWLRDDDANRYSITDGLMDGYDQYATETKCFRSSYTLAATSGTSEYLFSAFASGATRIFEITEVGFNNAPLTMELDTQLARTWRYDAPGTPAYWIPWGSQTFRLHPTPSTTGTILLEGYCTPDPSGFAASGDVPLIVGADHGLLAVYAALQIIIRNPNAFNNPKYAPLETQWRTGIQQAVSRYKSTSMADIRPGSRMSLTESPTATI